MAKFQKDKNAAKTELKANHKNFSEAVKAAFTPEHFEAWKTKLKAAKKDKKEAKIPQEDDNAIEAGE